ncbi:amidohydrolase [Algimonas arctica]|uniref:Amidohydrolase n=1 Tax=Algimonas arctica TaxID=1479486 RepID=A0A8J3CP80_9PROT|nr:amidohydrolase family protein [Algimonas arctica]GHA81254.1 amidohydrolase [Algimonas arctica]
MRLRSYLFSALSIGLVGCATSPDTTLIDPNLIAFTGATLVSLDKTHSDRQDITILVQDGVILSLIDTPSVPENAARVDVTGLYALPGIIDTHIHVATPPDTALAEKRLRDMLRSGVTTGRSMADDLRAAAELSRRAYQNEIESPDIVYSAVFAGPTFMADPRVQSVTAGLTPGDVPWMRRIDAQSDIKESVTLARGSGAMGIKIYADLTTEQVESIAAEAKRQDIPTWAHTAVYPAGPEQVAGAGVTTMSHACSLAHVFQPTMPVTYGSRDPMPDRDETQPLPEALIDTFAAMKQHGTILDATSMIYDWLEDQSPKPSLCSGALSADMTRLAVEHGVRISTGTDFVTDAGPSAIHLEMRYLHETVGLDLDDVWTSATETGAEVVNAKGRVGHVAPGYFANILFYTDDPTEDLKALDTLQMVVKRGHMTSLR